MGVSQLGLNEFWVLCPLRNMREADMKLEACEEGWINIQVHDEVMS